MYDFLFLYSIKALQLNMLGRSLSDPAVRLDNKLLYQRIGIYFRVREGSKSIWDMSYSLSYSACWFPSLRCGRSIKKSMLMLAAEVTLG